MTDFAGTPWCHDIAAFNRRALKRVKFNPGIPSDVKTYVRAAVAESRRLQVVGSYAEARTLAKQARDLATPKQGQPGAQRPAAIREVHEHEA